MARTTFNQKVVQKAPDSLTIGLLMALVFAALIVGSVSIHHFERIQSRCAIDDQCENEFYRQNHALRALNIVMVTLAAVMLLFAVVLLIVRHVK